jgi:hypothetical protein
VLTPDFNRRDLENATTSQALTRGRHLAEHVEDLDWDEYSLWGALPGEGIGIGELLLHHTRPLGGECPCPDGRGGELCAHIVALGLACLGDETTLTDRLATMPHHDLVALVVDLVDRSAWAREAIWSRIAR